ncbi:hypothetical protein [Mesorhizobium sp. B2-4-6]|nr:hypothetical protein [Mesorhizobium sp. B2-4-6]
MCDIVGGGEGGSPPETISQGVALRQGFRRLRELSAENAERF